MLARQITADLQSIRDGTAPGNSRALVSKGIFFSLASRFATLSSSRFDGTTTHPG